MTAERTNRDDRPVLIFSVDVEDWGQSVLDRRLPIGEYCAENVRRMLDLIGGSDGASATFFVLGKFADRHPDVVRRIGEAGHEIGCHGYGHVPIQELTRSEFEADVERATGVISDIIGEAMEGFRAPVFSVVRRTLWALDVLSAAGYRYDSSIFPFAGSRYGIANWPTEAVRVRLAGGRSLVEYPLTVGQIGETRIPISGGGYARLLPGRVLCRLLGSAAARRSTPPVFYCHPYEIDPDEFARRSPTPTWGERRIGVRLRWHQGLGRRGFARKIELLGRRFRFCTFRSVLASMGELDEIHLDRSDAEVREPQPV